MAQPPVPPGPWVLLPHHPISQAPSASLERDQSSHLTLLLPPIISTWLCWGLMLPWEGSDWGAPGQRLTQVL